jgi:acyl carrier protein
MSADSTTMKLYQVFRKTFPTLATNFETFDELAQGDFDEWDSLGNLVLLLAIEEEFGIRFTQTELSEVCSVVRIKEVVAREQL